MRAVILHSAGVDSTTALYLAASVYSPTEVLSLCITYGNKHAPRESYLSQQIAWELGCAHHVICVDAFRGQPSSLLVGSAGEMTGADTVVKGRNRVFLFTAAGVADGAGAGEVWFGPHKGDAEVYEDCRPAFVEDINRELGGSLVIRAPFLFWDKAQIVKRGQELGVPWRLTWSCYAPNGDGTSCRKCGACTERARAFAAAGVVDTGL